MYLVKLFSEITYNMCKIVTDFSVVSYKVHEVCIKTCILCSKGVPLLYLFFLEQYIRVLNLTKGDK